MNFIVLKFGGTSVSSSDCWKNIVAIAKARLEQGYRPVIVCSAPSRVSNLLEETLADAVENRSDESLKTVETIYCELAVELKVNFAELIGEEFERLRQIILGIGLLKEASPRIKAQVMAFGETLLTRLGVAFLNQQGLRTYWQFAPDILTNVMQKHQSLEQRYLSVDCDYSPDFLLQQKFSCLQEEVIITQGFIASNREGEVVLLGRGGSDVSAAYFAAKLQAVCCEIWTDVPGIYTTNPHWIPAARLLKHLSYAETQEIASMGAKVLHPRCIQPVRENNIPLEIKYTREPEREGTRVDQAAATEPHIKSILIKNEVILISLDSVAMWHQIGFLAEVFACFKQHGLSIDCVSTSELNVTVSLDKKANLIDSKVLTALLEDLNQFAEAKVIGPCAVIGLVGHRIRTILHKLGGVFSLFESKQVHLLTQAANDLNLAFVVNEEDAMPIAQKLHNLLIEQNQDSVYFGQSWQKMFGNEPESQPAWWQGQAEVLIQKARQETPLYVYDQDTLRQRAKQLLSCQSIDRVFFAMKANSNPEILTLFHTVGLGFECVSLGEVERVLSLFPAMDKHRILFTPNFADREEYQRAFELGLFVTVDNLYPLQHWPEIFSHQSFFIRIDPGHGYGHHKYVTTGGKNSKFGIPVDQLPQVATLAGQHHFTVIGLHSHSGSGVTEADHWVQLANFLMSQRVLFPHVKYFDLGGGLSIPEKPGQLPVDISAIDAALARVKSSAPTIELWIEPGRYLVAEAGVLLAKVTQCKEKAGVHYLGINAGMNSLIRPALYGAYHEIVNLSKLNNPRELIANIVGPICESGDTLGYSRLLPATEAGDILLIANVGAYGASMASHYNLRRPAEEYVINTQK